MDRRERISELANTVCTGARHEAAARHVDAIQVASEITGMRYKESPYDSFLSGWDAAMELRADELRDENQQLHGMVIELCARLALRRCEICNGLGAGNDLEPCPHCDRGYVDAPPGEPERVVKEISGK